MAPLIGTEDFLGNSPLLATCFLIPTTQGSPSFTPGSPPLMIKLAGVF